MGAARFRPVVGPLNESGLGALNRPYFGQR